MLTTLCSILGDHPSLTLCATILPALVSSPLPVVWEYRPLRRKMPNVQSVLLNVGSAVLVLEEDVDGGGGAAVHVRVPAPGHVFHEANVAGAKHVPGSVTGANLDFAG